MARHHGHRLQLQFSANRFWSRDSRKRQAPALPPFPGAAISTAHDKMLWCSGQGFLQFWLLPWHWPEHSAWEQPPYPPLFCLADSYSACNTQLQCHLLWEAFSDDAVV